MGNVLFAPPCGTCTPDPRGTRSRARRRGAAAAVAPRWCRHPRTGSECTLPTTIGMCATAESNPRNERPPASGGLSVILGTMTIGGQATAAVGGLMLRAFAAALQSASESDAPVTLQVDTARTYTVQY